MSMYHFAVVKVKQHPNLLRKICEENNRFCLTIFINLKGGIVEVVCNTAYIAFVSRTGTGDKKKTIELSPDILQSKRIMISKTKKYMVSHDNITLESYTQEMFSDTYCNKTSANSLLVSFSYPKKFFLLLHCSWTDFRKYITFKSSVLRGMGGRHRQKYGERRLE